MGKVLGEGTALYRFQRHETRRVVGAGSSVVPDFPVARWIGYRLENDPYTPNGGPLWGLSFPRSVCDRGSL